MGSLWTLVTILGPILLAAAIIWAIQRNKKAGGLARTEQATRENYARENAAAAKDEAVNRAP